MFLSANPARSLGACAGGRRGSNSLGVRRLRLRDDRDGSGSRRDRLVRAPASRSRRNGEVAGAACGSSGPPSRFRRRRRRCTGSATPTPRARRGSRRSRTSCSDCSRGRRLRRAQRGVRPGDAPARVSQAAGIAYRPSGVACTLEAFRLLDPLAPDHRLESICERRGISLVDAHDAPSDVSATAALLRLLLDEGIAPETVELDHGGVHATALARRHASGHRRADPPRLRARIRGRALTGAASSRSSPGLQAPPMSTR